MEKLLVYKDLERTNNLKRQLEAKVNQFNAIIDAFNTFQAFEKVKTQADAIKLIYNPVKRFDGIVLKYTNMPNGNADAVCILHNIDKKGYLSQLNELFKKTTYEFIENEPLAFKNGLFTLNESEFNKVIEKYNIYAETPEQIAYIDYWQGITNTFNTHFKNGLIKADKAPVIAQACGLQWSLNTQEFYCDPKILAYTMLNTIK